MATAAKKHMRIDQMDDGDWLARLLADAQRKVIRHPTPGAISRIRQRLFSKAKGSGRAAA